MKQFFLIIALVSFSLHAQQNNLEVTHKVNDDKTVTFSYRKYVPGSYHVSLNFKRIDNASDPRFSNSVSGSSGTLFTLRPISSNKGIGFQYNYSYIRGKLNPKVDTDYVYRIPLANQKKVMVKNLNYLGEKYGNVEPKNWTAFQFIASTNDTVFAARKGIVVKVVNEYAANTNQSISYSSNENSILIEHKDGTFARYSVLKKNSILVKEGQKVYPDTPIALAGTYDTPENGQVRFSVYYLNNDKKKKKKENLSNQTHYNAFINPKFLTTGGEKYLAIQAYNQAVVTDDLVEAEMTKRERKKRKKH